MVSLWKWIILTPLLKLPKNGEDWGKLIVAKGIKKLAKIQNIAQSGHTANHIILLDSFIHSQVFEPIFSGIGVEPTMVLTTTVLAMCHQHTSAATTTAAN